MMLRRATLGDAGAVADVYLAARAAASPAVAWAHDAAEVRQWIAGVLIPRGGMTVAVAGLTVHGYIAMAGEWVDHIFIHPLSWRRGIGSRLIAHAKKVQPAGLRLWTFQSNTRARAFYERHGFSAAQMTDGAGNEEHEPDVLYVWQ